MVIQFELWRKKQGPKVVRKREDQLTKRKTKMQNFLQLKERAEKKGKKDQRGTKKRAPSSPQTPFPSTSESGWGVECLVRTRRSREERRTCASRAFSLRTAALGY